MAADWKSLLAQHGPKLVMGLLAAKQGGPQASAAFLQGLQESSARREQRTYTEQDRARQAQRETRADETQAAQLANMETDNQRQQQAFEMQKFERALGLMQATGQQQAELATDPVQAENVMKQTAQSAAGAYGLAPDALTGFIPNMGPAITAGQKKRAKARYAEFVKAYGAKAAEAEGSLKESAGEFAGMTLAQVREMGESFTPQPTEKSSAVQIVDLGGRKMALDPSKLTHGQTFQETPPAGGGAPASRFWVMRNGKLIRITEAEYQPGDQPAATREQGRAVTSGDAGRISELNTSLDDLATLERQLGQTGAASKVGAMLPNVVTEFTGWGESAKQRQAVIDRVKQVIGKALEGGVLRKEDEYKYVKILPTIGDPPEVAKTKIAGLRTAITQRRTRQIEALTDAGFDTSKFEAAPTPSTPGMGSAADPLGLFK